MFDQGLFTGAQVGEAGEVEVVTIVAEVNGSTELLVLRFMIIFTLTQFGFRFNVYLMRMLYEEDS